MILPTKHISQERSLLGLSAYVLSELERPKTVTALWERVRVNEAVGSFERFVLGLDLLYTLGVIELRDGLLWRPPQ